MTKDEFLQKLSETPRDWRLSQTGRLRLGSQCPISSLRKCRAVYADDIALDLGGWVREHGAEILEAADERTPADPYTIRLRRDMLRACGLKAAR